MTDGINNGNGSGSKKLGEVIVVTSGKGGVGKTTTTASLGSALALRGKRVLVIDADIGLRNLDVILGLAKQGMTMVIVTHEMGFARAVADKIMFVDRGKVCEISEPESFFTSPKTERAQQFLNIFEY